VYLPLSQHYEPNAIVLARSSGDLPVEPLRRALRSADPLLATAFIGDGARLGAIERVMLGTATTIGHGLAAFALLLALAGLYGVLSHVVSLRSRELAVRVALGATAHRVATMVLRDGLRPVVEGLVIALGGAMLVRKVLSVTVAEGLSTIEPVSFLVATAVLLIGGFVACLIPARRASRIDPNVVLKEG
jgi:ABC-type antimicrobial peptide transport system permease subunit